MRVVVGAVLAAMVASSAVAQLNSKDWAQSLDPGGWTLVTWDGSGQGIALFMKPKVVSRTPNGRLMWVKYEYREPSHGVLSASVLQEFDCAGGRSRIVEANSYPGRSLSGPIISSETSPDVWTHPSPDSMADSLNAFACSVK